MTHPVTRILLLGAGGQVGQELQQILPHYGSWDVVACDRQSLDLAQWERIPETVQHHQPDLIVNAAAYTAVDRAETEPELAQAINGIAPTVLAKTARQLSIPLIHISTDYVFDGMQGSPYTEQDRPNPQGVYGETKLLGERGIQHGGDGFVIIRTAWVYGALGQSNFVKTMLRLGAEREEIRVVADQIGTPTWAQDLARAIAHRIVSHGGEHPISGGTVYHFTNSGVASWYDFASAIFEEARPLGFPLQVQRIIPITTQDYPTLARRPSYSVLNCQKFAQFLGEPSPHWRQSLRAMLQQLSMTL